jgi:hypothetical protein
MMTPPAGASSTPQQKKTSLWIGLAGVGVAIGALSVAGILVSKRTAQQPGTAPMPPTATTIVASSASTTAVAAAQKIHVTVTVQPPKAKVSIDGKVVEGPFEAQADGSKHELKVEMPGYVAQTQTLTYDRDLAVPVILDKKAGGGAIVRPTAGAGTVKPTGTGEEDPLGF